MSVNHSWFIPTRCIILCHWCLFDEWLPCFQQTGCIIHQKAGTFNFCSHVGNLVLHSLKLITHFIASLLLRERKKVEGEGLRKGRFSVRQKKWKMYAHFLDVFETSLTIHPFTAHLRNYGKTNKAQWCNIVQDVQKVTPGFYVANFS